MSLFKLLSYSTCRESKPGNDAVTGKNGETSEGNNV